MGCKKGKKPPKKLPFMVALLFAGFTFAQAAEVVPYVEAGPGWVLGDTCIIHATKDGCFEKGVMGVVGAGVRWSFVDARVEHWSSLSSNDRGGEMASVRFRYEFKRK